MFSQVPQSSTIEVAKPVVSMLKIPSTLDFLLNSVHNQYHVSLFELSQKQPVLLVFLRHLGCLFSREALRDLYQARADIEALGTCIAIVSMGPEEEAAELLAEHCLADLSLICSPDQSLYRAFGLGRTTARELLKPSVLKRALSASCQGHKICGIQADPMQMPGVFLLHKGSVLKEYRHETAGCRPDYFQLASNPQNLAESI